MKVLFLGTGDIAIPTFRWLLESDHELIALVTQPDKPAGRSMTLTPPRIKEVAEEAGVPVLQPEKIGSISEELETFGADLFVVMAYGQYLPKKITAIASKGCINLHASLLPRHRGASCIQAAIREGDERSGVTIMHVAPEMDAGNIIVSVETPIGRTTTGGELHETLSDLGPLALEKGLAELGPGTAQDSGESTYAPKLLRPDGEIDWTQSAESIERLIRAYDPWPGTFTTFPGRKGRQIRLKIFPQTCVVSKVGQPGEIVRADSESVTVCCGEDALEVSQVQIEGKKRGVGLESLTVGLKLG